MVTAHETNRESQGGDGGGARKKETPEVPEHVFNDARNVIEDLHDRIKRYEELDAASNQDRNGVFSAGLANILKLRKSHRTLCELVERLREQTAGVKSELDVSSLHLQNLLYQKNHYQREIEGCRSYASAFSDAELELLTEEEFQETLHKMADVQDEAMPEPGCHDAEDTGRGKSEDEEGVLEAMDVEKGCEEGDEGVEGKDDKAHVIMLGRLRHEVHRRKVTLQELAALKSERDSVAADLAKQRNILSVIDTEVASLKQSVQRSLLTFEGDSNGSRLLNVYAAEFRMPQ